MQITHRITHRSLTIMWHSRNTTALHVIYLIGITTPSHPKVEHSSIPTALRKHDISVRDSCVIFSKK